MTTWNPILSTVTATPDTSLVFDSSKIPGEIMDLLVVNSDTLKAHPELGKALTGAWYEIVALMHDKGPRGADALAHMAKASGTDLAGYKAQLDATRLFATPAEAVAFATSAALPETMQRVARFSFDHGLLGEGARDAEAVGMSFAGGVVRGDQANVRLRFDPSYMQMAADGSL